MTDIQTWGDEVPRLADKIQELRKDADRQIVSSITDVNNQIKRIFELNSQIVVEQNLSRDSATLEEQREDALSKLSEYMDISTFSMSNGFLGVTGARGMVLVDSGYRALDYTATCFWRDFDGHPIFANLGQEGRPRHRIGDRYRRSI